MANSGEVGTRYRSIVDCYFTFCTTLLENGIVFGAAIMNYPASTTTTSAMSARRTHPTTFYSSSWTVDRQTHEGGEKNHSFPPCCKENQSTAQMREREKEHESCPGGVPFSFHWSPFYEGRKRKNAYANRARQSKRRGVMANNFGREK